MKCPPCLEEAINRTRLGSSSMLFSTWFRGNPEGPPHQNLMTPIWFSPSLLRNLGFQTASWWALLVGRRLLEAGLADRDMETSASVWFGRLHSAHGLPSGVGKGPEHWTGNQELCVEVTAWDGRHIPAALRASVSSSVTEKYKLLPRSPFTPYSLTGTSRLGSDPVCPGDPQNRVSKWCLNSFVFPGDLLLKSMDRSFLVTGLNCLEEKGEGTEAEHTL